MDGVEPEYESDPEEIKRSLTARRREASDDEDDDDDKVKEHRDEIDSDQSDEEAGTVKYDDDENKSEDDDDEYMEDTVDDAKKVDIMVKAGEEAEGHVDGEEEEKEKQLSSVPTGGAFYMHDDRFQEMSGGGRSRRGRGGRRSWGSGDERKWGHDKYEEMNTGEKHYDRTSRGGFRGRGRGRGQGRGYPRGNSSNTSSGSGQQIFVPKAVTQGGGDRKHDIPLNKGNQAHSVQRKQSGNFHGSQHSNEKMPHPDSRRSQPAPAKTGNEGTYIKKNVVSSSLSSASPPFYPSVSSSNMAHGIQAGMERLHTDESAAPSGKKYRNTKSGFSPAYTAQTFQSSSQGRGAAAAGKEFYPKPQSQGDRFSSPMQFNGDSKGSGQNSTRPSGQGPDQQYAVIRSSTQKTSSSRHQYPPGEIESALETRAPIAKGKGSFHPSGNGSLMYNGSQVMGRAENLASGEDSNFPAFLPVMQFGNQHGGVPTFGMAFPGYVQPENGVGNPEMTWMPVLAGPGGLGASYSPQYAAIDGSYQANKPVLPSSAGSSSKGNSMNNLNNLETPMERPGVTETWVPKRQNNNPSKQPRRYSEMSFSK
ncbi:unnamed protein product [Cochlearia groenlandica]